MSDDNDDDRQSQKAQPTAKERLRFVVRELVGLASHLDGLLAEPPFLPVALAESSRSTITDLISCLEMVVEPFEVAARPRYRGRRGLGRTPAKAQATRDAIAALAPDDQDAVLERAAVAAADNTVSIADAEATALAEWQAAHPAKPAPAAVAS